MNNERDDESMESLLAGAEDLNRRLRRNEVVWAKVVGEMGESLLVDIGGKREGLLPVADFAPSKPPAVGQKVAVVWAGPGREGHALLSHKRARAELGWQSALKAHADRQRVHGRITRSVKGGFIADVGGVEAFLPASQVDLHPVRSPEKMIGTGTRAYILEIDSPRRRIVISRKAVLEEEASVRRERRIQELRVGESRVGRIRRVGTFGLIVDIGGLEGWVKIEDAGWGSPAHFPRRAPGDKVKVKVLSKPSALAPASAAAEAPASEARPLPSPSASGQAQSKTVGPRELNEKEWVLLGVKQLLPNPADSLRKKYPVNSVVSAKVGEVVPGGLKIELSDKTPAFCASSQLEPETRYEAGEPVKGVVVGVNRDTFEVMLSLKKYGEKKDRERVSQYLKPPKPLTLGQLLAPEEGREL